MSPGRSVGRTTKYYRDPKTSVIKSASGWSKVLGVRLQEFYTLLPYLDLHQVSKRDGDSDFAHIKKAVRENQGVLEKAIDIRRSLYKYAKLDLPVVNQNWIVTKVTYNGAYILQLQDQSKGVVICVIKDREGLYYWNIQSSVYGSTPNEVANIAYGILTFLSDKNEKSTS